MTIAACYVSPEGVVFGADSTSSINVGGDEHYFNHAQKIFEIGERADLAVVTWGLGNLRSLSYRTIFAVLGDSIGGAESVEVAAAQLRSRILVRLRNRPRPNSCPWTRSPRAQTTGGCAYRRGDESARPRGLACVWLLSWRQSDARPPAGRVSSHREPVRNSGAHSRPNQRGTPRVLGCPQPARAFDLRRGCHNDRCHRRVPEMDGYAR